MFADRVILAGSIYVAFLSTAQTCNAQEQSFTVSYELLPGSYLANFSPTKPSVQVGLVGSFDLEFSQKLGRINASLSSIMLSDSSGELYSVRGSGSYGEVVDVKANPTARPPNTSDFLLELDINEIKGVKIYVDLPVNPLVFPAILMGGFRDGVFNHPVESFVISIQAAPQEAARAQFFRRGDVLGDGRRDITDAVALLGFMFQGAAPPSCQDAADANDDGRIDLSDAVMILNHLFGGSGALPIPSAFCGMDPTDDELGCEGQEDCGL